MFPELRRNDGSVLFRAEPSDGTSPQRLVQPRANALIQRCYKDRTKKKKSQLRPIRQSTLITLSTEPSGRHADAFLPGLLERFNEGRTWRLSGELSQLWVLSLQYRDPALTHDHHLSQPNSSLFPTLSSATINFLPTQGD